MRVLLQRGGVLVGIQREHLGVGQEEDEATSHLGDRTQPLKGRVVEVLNYLEGFVHAVVDRVAAVEFSFLRVQNTQTINVPVMAIPH